MVKRDFDFAEARCSDSAVGITDCSYSGIVSRVAKEAGERASSVCAAAPSSILGNTEGTAIFHHSRNKAHQQIRGPRQFSLYDSRWSRNGFVRVLLFD